MGKGFFQVPTAINEPIKSYSPGSPERKEVLDQYKAYFNGNEDIPFYIGNQEIRTGNTKPISPPHDHKHIVGQYHLAEKKHVDQAIENALESRKAWANLTWEQRSAIFMKAAELIAGLCLRKVTGHLWHVQGACTVNGDGIYESFEVVARQVREYKSKH